MAKQKENNATMSKQKPDVEQNSKFSPAQIKQFAGEVKKEYGKIVWPPRKQTAASTLVVVIMVILISCYLGGVDLLLGKMIGLVLK